MRADRAELFSWDNITCAHNNARPEINVMVYFTFHRRGRETRCTGLARNRPVLATQNHFTSFRRAHGKPAVLRPEFGALGNDFAGSIALFTAPHERERRLEK